MQNYCSFFPQKLFLAQKTLFRKLGYCVGCRPRLFIAIPLVACLILSLGILNMDLSIDVGRSYSPVDSPSRTEYDLFANFFDTKPFINSLIIRAADGGNLLRLDQMRATVDIIDYLTYDFKVKFRERNMTLSDVCYPLCNQNEIFRAFYSAMKAKIEAMKPNSTTQELLGTNLDYPTAKILHRNYYLPGKFNGVEMKTVSEQRLDTITSIKSVAVFKVDFNNLKINETGRKFLEAWEIKVYDFIEHFHHASVKILMYSDPGYRAELLRLGWEIATKNFPLGISLLTFFIALSTNFSSWLRSPTDTFSFEKKHILVPLAAALCPLISLGAGAGLAFICGIKYSSIMSAVLFLVIGIGVDDGFLMILAWEKSGKLKNGEQNLSVPNRLASTLAEVGPSISITSLTNFVAFGIGALTPTPAIQRTCTVASIAIFIDFICQVTFFAGTLAISEKEPTMHQSDSTAGLDQLQLKSQAPLPLRRNVRKVLQDKIENFFDAYCQFVAHWITPIPIFLLLIFYWMVAFRGIQLMEPELSREKLFLKDSLQTEIIVKHRPYIWNEYHPVLILVHRSPDFSDYDQSLEFTKLVERFESHPLSLGRQSTQLWVLDYKEFLDFSISSDFFFDYENHNDGSLIGDKEILGNFDTEQLPLFMQMADYEHWNGTVTWNLIDGKPLVSRFAFSTAFHNCDSDAIRLELLQKWREIAADFPQFGVSIFESESIFMDQMSSLKGVTFKTVATTLIVMAVICYLSIPSLLCVIIASIGTLSISIGVYGFLSWMGYYLDPITMACILVCIGLSVDFTAHITYLLYSNHVLRNGMSKQESLRLALNAAGWPMVQAAISTVLAFSALVVNAYPVRVFLVAVFLVSCFGLIHGLLIVPTFFLNTYDWINVATINSWNKTNQKKVAGPIQIKNAEPCRDQKPLKLSCNAFVWNRVSPAIQQSEKVQTVLFVG